MSDGPTRQRMESAISFGVSTVLHLGLILGLHSILFSLHNNGSQAVQFSMNVSDGDSELTQFDLTTEDLQVQPQAPMEPSLDTTIGAVSLSPVADADLGKMESSDQAGSGTGQLLKEGGGGGGDGSGQGKSSKSRASFFGAEAYGNRFVFVIDSSGSMRGDRWDSLKVELVRALKGLSPDQEFFVISFDSMAHPMFGLIPPRGKFLHPTSKNIERVRNWMQSIRHGSQTFPSSSIGIAMELKPDAIFLLSDGEINDSTIQDLRIWNRKLNEDEEEETIVPIHTVLLMSEAGYATLETIAYENSGTFTPVRRK